MRKKLLALPHYFSRSISYNMVASLYYQVCVTAHHLMLFKAIGAFQFGALGSLFSLIYAASTLGQFGFDGALAPFFNILSASRVQGYAFFKKFLPWYLAPLFLTGFILAVILFLASYLLGIGAVTLICATLSGILVITESIKKSLKHFFQLTFSSRFLATVEITLITLYFSALWLGPLSRLSLITCAPTIDLFLMYHLVYSLSGLLILSFALLHYYYHKETSTQMQEQVVSSQRFRKMRATVFLIECSTLLFSGNVFIPLCAAAWGTPVAGALKLVTTMAHALSTLIRHTCGFSCEALFSSLKHLMSGPEKIFLFSTITFHFYSFFALCIILVGIVALALALIGTIPATLLTPAAGVLFLLILSENFLLIHEKFILVHEQPRELLLLTAAKIVGVFPVFIVGSRAYDPLILILSLFAFRIILLVAYAKYNTCSALNYSTESIL